MENYDYEKPVSELLHLGRPERREDPIKWIDYIEEYGFTSEHFLELQRLFNDERFQDRDYWEKPEGIAFVHVLRVLGQLNDKSTLPFLLHVAETEEDNDWIWEEIPIVLSLFGKDILPDLKESMLRVRDNHITDSTILNALNRLAIIESEIQTEIFEFWLELLLDYKTNDYGLNSHLIVYLSEHKYEPALPLMEQAFKAKRVDEFICGDYFDILVKYGLEDDDPGREKEYFGPSGEAFQMMRDSLDRLLHSTPEPPTNRHIVAEDWDFVGKPTANARNAKKKKKAKRKQAKKSRQKNRKRK